MPVLANSADWHSYYVRPDTGDAAGIIVASYESTQNPLVVSDYVTFPATILLEKNRYVNFKTAKTWVCSSDNIKYNGVALWASPEHLLATCNAGTATFSRRNECQFIK